MTNLPHIFGRVFSVPLLIQQNKLDVIIAALAPRFGVVLATDLAVAAPAPVVKSRKPYGVTNDGIAVVSVLGSLVRRAGPMDAMSGMSSYAQIGAEIADAVNDRAIQGVLLDCDSPGGEAGGVFDLSDQVYAVRGIKPIVASVSGGAFSSAYAIASATDRIFMGRTDGVGSIGVVFAHVDQSLKDEKEGLKYTILSRGDRKADLNSHQPLSDGASEMINAELDRMYGMFVDTVVRNRGLSAKTVKGTEAGLYFGQNGIEAGLADQLGTPDDALAYMRAQISKKSYPVASAAGTQPKGAKRMEGTQAAADGTLMAGMAAEVVDLKKMKADAEASGYGMAVEVYQLCALSGKPELAGDYLAKQATPANVRADLMATRVKADADQGIVSNFQAGASTGVAMRTEDTPAVIDARRRAEKARGTN